MELPAWVEENKVQIGLGGMGLVLIRVGVVQGIISRMEKDSEVVVERLEEKLPVEKTLIEVVADVGGGTVEKPGIYRFVNEAKINDALIAAGGLTSDANRDYVSRRINLAEALVDVMKLYILSKDDPCLF